MKQQHPHGQTAKHSATGKHHNAKTSGHKNAAKKHHPKKQQHKPATAPAQPVTVAAKHPKPAKPAKWSPNLDVACCAHDALAASLRLAGHAVSAMDVLALYWLTASDPDAGAPILAALEAAREHGLAGIRPVWFAPVPALAPGDVLGIDGLPEYHAVTLGSDGCWLTWGEQLPPMDSTTVAEAWTVRWPA